MADQECRRDWADQGNAYSWDDIVGLAEREAPLRSIIDPDAPEFFHPGGMEEKIGTSASGPASRSRKRQDRSPAASMSRWRSSTAGRLRGWRRSRAHDWIR